SPRLLSYAQLKDVSPAEALVDIQILDEAGNRIMDLEGIVCRPIEHRMQQMHSSLYEYQWKLTSRRMPRCMRNSNHLPSPRMLARVVEEYGNKLWQRFDRLRYQSEFRSFSRSAAVAYIVRALQQQGWVPAKDRAMPVESLAERLRIAPQYHRWLKLVLNELKN